MKKWGCKRWTILTICQQSIGGIILYSFYQCHFFLRWQRVRFLNVRRYDHFSSLIITDQKHSCRNYISYSTVRRISIIQVRLLESWHHNSSEFALIISNFFIALLSNPTSFPIVHRPLIFVLGICDQCFLIVTRAGYSCTLHRPHNIGTRQSTFPLCRVYQKLAPALAFGYIKICTTH